MTNYLWVKSHEGDVTEDYGFAYMQNEQEVYDALYNKYGYNQYSDCIQVIDITDYISTRSDMDGVVSIPTELLQ